MRHVDYRQQSVAGDDDQGRHSLSDFLSAEDLAQFDAMGWSHAEQEGLWRIETCVVPLNGAPLVPVSLLLLAHRSAAGERYFSLVIRDRRERALREAQQRHHQDEMAHTARLVSLGELASGIAHEINQPLAAVVNYANASQRYLQTLGSILRPYWMNWSVVSEPLATWKKPHGRPPKSLC